MRALAILDGLIASASGEQATIPACPQSSAKTELSRDTEPAPTKPRAPRVEPGKKPKPATEASPVDQASQAKLVKEKTVLADASQPTETSSSLDLTPTMLLYQSDTYLFSCSATVLAVRPQENGSSWSIALDETCFHPQGGGQPSDCGTITRIDIDSPIAVSMVKKDPSGIVWHECAEDPKVTAGTKVRCTVDEAFRRKNARLHSAGHLIDVAMARAGCSLRPTKGYHFSPGSYVEYEGKLDASDRDTLLPKVQAEIEELIAAAIPTEVVPQQPVSEAGVVRVVSVGGQACPCGGTHVKDTKELVGVKVEGIKTKGKVTRVSYSIID